MCRADILHNMCDGLRVLLLEIKAEELYAAIWLPAWPLLPRHARADQQDGHAVCWVKDKVTSKLRQAESHDLPCPDLQQAEHVGASRRPQPWLMKHFSSGMSDLKLSAACVRFREAQDCCAWRGGLQSRQPIEAKPDAVGINNIRCPTGTDVDKAFH